MKIAKYRHFIKNKSGETRAESVSIANALFAELLNYGIVADNEVISRISKLKPEKALKICKEIADEYVAPNLNPPLFKNWEDRTYFSLGEFIIQVYGYVFQISGNDLKDPEFSQRLKTGIDFKKFKHLTLASHTEIKEYANNLFNAGVSQDKATAEKLIKAAKYIDVELLPEIKSDEARIAALMGVSKDKDLLVAFNRLKCKPADALRYAAAKNDFSLVKLPHDVKYANLTWNERVSSLGFLSKFDIEYLNEAMGMNRGAWTKYFKHIHLLTQKGFQNRFKDVCLANFISEGNRLEKAPESFSGDIKQLISDNLVEVTKGGALAYRTFASRIQSAIDNKSFEAIKHLGEQRPGYVLRNLTAVSNGISAKDNASFVRFVKSLLKEASADVLFSILSIDVSATWRIIDVKGDTRVEKADYNPVIGEIQKDIEREMNRRWGYNGVVKVQEALKGNIVPFLAKNTNLARGTTFKVEKKDYLYFFVHWIQKNMRTDLDSSYLAFDRNWNTQTISFRDQANDYIAHSGDTTNAPAPNGATEYGKIRLNKIPSKIKYIAPIINVFAGDVFSDNTEVKAGFFTSDEDQFTLDRKHNTFNLDQPAQANIPFILDVEKGEILLLDINVRERKSYTCDGYVETIRNVIEATKTHNYITIGKLAKMLSRKKSEGVSLTITNKAEGKGEITPESLFSLFA